VKRSRVWLLLALLLVIALVTSGCFQIRSFQVSPRSLAANQVATVNLNLYPLSTSSAETQPGRVVLLVGTHDIAYDRTSRFDLSGNWGGPTGRASSVALRDLIRGGGVCQANGVDAQEITGFTWRATISAADLGVDGPTAQQLDDVLRVKLYFKSPANAAADMRGNVIIFAGIWDDGLTTADGIPQAGEVACAGLISFSIPYTDNAA